MTENIDRIYNQITGVIEALESMSQEERQEAPKKTFMERYSQHRKLAMDSIASIGENH